MTAVPQKSLKIDQQQAQKQLWLLGYKRGDKIFMRYIHPNPAEGQPKSIKKSRLNWEECAQYQSKGYDAYFVVNGGGDTDAAVKAGKAIFYEHDDLPKDIQQELWRNLGLPEPTFQVDTGGKSIHSYWVFHQPIGIKDWCGLQEDLLEFADGDRSIKNPSRILRLAGCRYMKGDNPGSNIATIITASGKYYSYLELRDVIQVQKSQASPLDSIELPLTVSVPLEDCLTKRSREMLASGSTAPDKKRNNSGIELARDLIGTSAYLEKIGQTYDGNPEILFFDWCRAVALDTDKPKGQPEAIWKSAQKTNPTPGSGEEGVQACIKAWHWNTNLKPSRKGFGSRSGSSGGNGNGRDGGNGSNKIINFPGTESPDIEEITKHIDDLIQDNPSSSRITTELNILSQKTRIHTLELRKLYEERVKESQLEDERDDTQKEVNELLNIETKILNLRDYLPSDLSDPLIQWCKWLNILPQTVLTALLAGTSSLHKTGTELVIHRAQGFTVPPTIFAALVAESGQKKSPIFSNIIRKPLNILKREKMDAYTAAMEDYSAELEIWSAAEAGERGEPPKEPKKPPIFFFSNTTGEAIPNYSKNYPEKTLLGLVDELAGHFNSSNAYRNGRGSDKQDLLSYFDGVGQTVLRAKEGVRVDQEKLYLSMFGTIQPEVLKRLMDDCSDPDGSWARFLFVNQPLAAATLDDDDGYSIQIADRLADYYRKIDQLPEMEYRLSREAFKRYQSFYNTLERMRVRHPKPGMRALYSKMEGYVGRIAINLHCLWELASGKAVPDEEISLPIMEMAIELTKFYIAQTKLIHTHSDDESLPAHIARLIAQSKRLEANADKNGGWIKANTFCSTFSKNNRPTAQQARQMFQEAVATGHGKLRGEGNRLEFHWFCDNSISPVDPSGLNDLMTLNDQLHDRCHEVKTIDFTDVSSNLMTVNDTPPSGSGSGCLDTSELVGVENIPTLNGCHEVTNENSRNVDTVGNAKLHDPCHEPAIKRPEVIKPAKPVKKTEPQEVEDKLPQPIIELHKVFASCAGDELETAIKGYKPEDIETAIALIDTAPLRHKIRKWWESSSQYAS